jgi:heme exporter protein D
MWPGIGPLTEFLAMGGYGAYVWSAFGFTMVVLAGLLWQSIRFARKQAHLLARLQAERPQSRVRRRKPNLVRHSPAIEGQDPTSARAPQVPS